MKEIKLSETLKKHKAVVLMDGDKTPDGYQSVFGGFLPSGDFSIAIPEEFTTNPILVNMLSDEASDCFFRAMQKGL